MGLLEKVERTLPLLSYGEVTRSKDINMNTDFSRGHNKLVR